MQVNMKLYSIMIVWSILILFSSASLAENCSTAATKCTDIMREDNCCSITHSYTPPGSHLHCVWVDNSCQRSLEPL